MAIDVPTKANPRIAVLLKSETKTTVLCRQSQEKPEKSKTKNLKCLLVAWQFSTSYGGKAIQDSSPS